MLADDTEEMRDSLAELVLSDPSLELVGTASDTDEAIDLARRAQPEVALLDVKMPAGGGPRAVREIRRESPGTRMVALSAYGDRASVLEMLRAGASGFLVKGASEQVLDTIHRTAGGQTILSGQVAGHVITELAEKLESDAADEADRAARLERIQRVLAEGLLRIAFQPIVELETGAVWGVEALARFDLEPRRSPEMWFAEAESLELRTELEVAAVRTALSFLPTLDPSWDLSINVSPKTILSPTLGDAIKQCPLGRIVLEITEHLGIEDYGAINEALAEFRPLGIRVAIDDAGAGFASMRHILQVGPDVIKLDISLIQRIEDDPARHALVRSLIEFAHEIGATVVAEGIETPQQLEALRSLGVSHGQGSLLGSPAVALPEIVGRL